MGAFIGVPGSNPGGSMNKGPKNPFWPMGLGKWGTSPIFQLATEEQKRTAIAKKKR
jgi:hypothetical protein